MQPIRIISKSLVILFFVLSSIVAHALDNDYSLKIKFKNFDVNMHNRPYEGVLIVRTCSKSKSVCYNPVVNLLG